MQLWIPRIHGLELRELLLHCFNQVGNIIASRGLQVSELLKVHHEGFDLLVSEFPKLGTLGVILWRPFLQRKVLVIEDRVPCFMNGALQRNPRCERRFQLREIVFLVLLERLRRGLPVWNCDALEYLLATVVFRTHTCLFSTRVLAR